MVTCRELVVEFARILVTLSSWFFGFAAGLYLLLRVVTEDNFWPVALASNFVFYCLLPLVILVPLGLITRAKWGLLTSVPIAVIAVIWFAPYFLPKESVSASNPTVKIVTFNYYQSNLQIDLVRSWLGEVDPDVILLQEVPTDLYIPILLRFQAIYPYTASHMAFGADWGNLFLSRFPIVDSEQLTSVNDPTPNTQQRYELDIQGQIVAFYNVDVPLAYAEPRFEMPFGSSFLTDYATGYDDTVRDEHIQRVMNRIARESEPYIVAGDFNLGDHTVSYQALTEIMNDSYRERGRGLGATWPVTSVEGYLPGFVPALLRIDYIWHSSDFQTIEATVGIPLGSDHLPVYAELEILPG